MIGQDPSRARGASGNDPGPDHDALTRDHDVEENGLDEEPDLSPAQWRWARARAEEGFAARAIARVLNVHHPKITRAAVRGGWAVPWGRPAPSPSTADPAAPESPPTGASGPASGPQPPPGPRDRRPGPVAPRGAPRPAPVRPELGPPQDERSARLWHCRRCGLVGFDPNRGARAWHDRTICDAKVRRLDAGLEGTRRERPPWEARW